MLWAAFTNFTNINVNVQIFDREQECRSQDTILTSRGGIAMLLSVYMILVFRNNNVLRFGFVLVSLVDWTEEVILFRKVYRGYMSHMDDNISKGRLNGSNWVVV